ncbi:MAG TPA: hypothetical protein VF017_14200 [Thermoanaerobaculia bacterium]|nr:hypothetical protein [Thermoanaerobaculia bacterium]
MPHREPTLGVLMLEGKMAAEPGCLGSPDSFPYRVLRRVVPGSRAPRTLADVEAMAPAYAAAARQLAEDGADVITDNCNGRMVTLQERLAAVAGVPVVMSTLFLVPWVTRLIPGRRVGILALAEEDPGEWHYQACGWSSREIPIAVAGVGASAAWRQFLATKEIGPAQRREMVHDLVRATHDLLRQHPDLGSFVVECTLLPPCSQEVREAHGLPVFDILNALDFAVAGRSRPAGLNHH